MKIKNLSDEKLVALVINRDKEYFSYIIERYEGKLKSYLNKLINFSPEVEDLVQETLINAYENLQGFDRKKKFSSWIYRIAHNNGVNWIKKKKAAFSLDDNEYIKNYFKSSQDVFIKTASKEGKELILKEIYKLPMKYREPFILKVIEGRSYEEISDILRKPKNTIGTMISRAKKQLKNKLEKYDKR